MKCQDCNKQDREILVFSQKHLTFFLICEDCVTDEDYICPDGLLMRWRE